MVSVWTFQSIILCFVWMWDNVDVPEMQVEEASAGTGKETHLTDGLAITPELQISGPFLNRFLSSPDTPTPQQGHQEGSKPTALVHQHLICHSGLL